MIEAKNARVMSIVTPKVESYINEKMPAYMSTTVMVNDVDEDDERVKLRLMDKNEDVGTYQFYKDEDGNLVVADYFNEDLIYSTYDATQRTLFDADYSLPVTYNDVMSFLEVLEMENAYMFICIEDALIQHEELMLREGWNDRRIKQIFGYVPRDEFGERWYLLKAVTLNEMFPRKGN